jgi:Fe-S-cluster-containing hydrogenase component 2
MLSADFAERGYLSEEEFSRLQPSEERKKTGPVAILECVQDIPCNPCESACPFHAITVGLPITSLPVLHVDKCVGCGICIAKCPGLAIFVVDYSRPGPLGTVQLPYEFYPLPQVGDTVVAVDRKGETVDCATVVRVNLTAGQDHTAVITVAVPKQIVHVVRAIKVIGSEKS